MLQLASLLYFTRYISFCLKNIQLIDCINKIANENSQYLKMKSILGLIIFAALTSQYSILALKCYNCTDDGRVPTDAFCTFTNILEIQKKSWKKVDCAGSCATGCLIVKLSEVNGFEG